MKKELCINCIKKEDSKDDENPSLRYPKTLEKTIESSQLVPKIVLDEIASTAAKQILLKNLLKKSSLP